MDHAERYLEALELVNMADLSKVSGRAYRTLQSYRMGERRVTEDAARELVQYLRDRSKALTVAADDLEAALDTEGQHE